MISSFMLKDKRVVSCDLKILDEPNENEEILGEVKTGIGIAGEESKTLIEKGEILKIISHLRVNAKKSKDEEISFEFNIEISTLFEAKKNFTVKEDFSRVNKVEVLSFVYDDIKQIMDFMVNQTSYRGISIPFDFRKVVD